MEAAAGDRGAGPGCAVLGVRSAPRTALPAGRQRAARELRPLGRLQGHLAVVGLGDVGVGARRAGAEVGDGGVDEAEARGGEAPGVVRPELVPIGVRDGARHRDVVDRARIQVGVRIDRRRVPRVAHARRHVAAGPLLSQPNGRAVDRRRVHRLAELDVHVGVAWDVGGVRRRRPLRDCRRRRVGPRRVGDRDVARGWASGSDRGSRLGLVLDVAGVAGDVAAAAVIGVKALQLPSGVGVSPVRTLIATLVFGVERSRASSSRPSRPPGPRRRRARVKVPEAG